MKKLLTIVALVSFLAACNNSTDETTTKAKDSVAAAESPLMDAVNIADSVDQKIQDSTGVKLDSGIKK
jgi:nitrous oxide reductase accessory protein NosL